MEQTVTAKVKKITSSQAEVVDDVVVVEEPLEIQLSFVNSGMRVVRSVSITMRTPGKDNELAVGFLYTEGILKNPEDVEEVSELENNKICVVLRDAIKVDFNQLSRHFYTSSSCGVCGKTSLEALKMGNAQPFKGATPILEQGFICKMPTLLRKHQQTFAKTGGLHAAALFNTSGKIQLSNEDVGRHNAVDKVAGSILLDSSLDPAESILMVSGRTSYEILQKSIRAGIPFVAAVGAPSSLAVELANVFNVTLLGFLSEERFNVYSAPERVLAITAQA